MAGHQNSNAKKRAGSGKLKKTAQLHTNRHTTFQVGYNLLKLIKKMIQILRVFRNHI